MKHKVGDIVLILSVPNDVKNIVDSHFEKYIGTLAEITRIGDKIGDKIYAPYKHTYRLANSNYEIGNFWEENVIKANNITKILYSKKGNQDGS